MIGRFAPDRMRAQAVAGVAAGLFLLKSDPVLAQTLGQGSDDGMSVWRIVAALLLCLALAVGGAFALKAGLGRGRFFSFVAKRSGRLQHVE